MVALQKMVAYRPIAMESSIWPGEGLSGVTILEYLKEVGHDGVNLLLSQVQQGPVGSAIVDISDLGVTPITITRRIASP